MPVIAMTMRNTVMENLSKADALSEIQPSNNGPPTNLTIIPTIREMTPIQNKTFDAIFIKPPGEQTPSLQTAHNYIYCRSISAIACRIGNPAFYDILIFIPVLASRQRAIARFCYCP